MDTKPGAKYMPEIKQERFLERALRRVVPVRTAFRRRVGQGFDTSRGSIFFTARKSYSQTAVALYCSRQVRQAELEREIRRWKRTLALIRRKDGDVVDTSQVCAEERTHALRLGFGQGLGQGSGKGKGFLIFHSFFTRKRSKKALIMQEKSFALASSAFGLNINSIQTMVH